MLCSMDTDDVAEAEAEAVDDSFEWPQVCRYKDGWTHAEKMFHIAGAVWMPCRLFLACRTRTMRSAACQH